MNFVSLMIRDMDLSTVCPNGHELEVDSKATNGIFCNDVGHLVLDPVIHQFGLCFLCNEWRKKLMSKSMPSVTN